MSQAVEQRFRVPFRFSAVRFLVLALTVFGGSIVFAQDEPRTSTPETKQTTPPVEKPKTADVSPTGTLKGRVRADDGRVLSNAMVVARAFNGSMGLKSAQVDSEGRFSFDDMPAAVYLVFATAPGYVDEQITISDMEDWPKYLVGSQINIRLVKGGVITGTVIDSKGQPVVGIPVRAVAKGAGSLMSMSGSSGMSETDDRGVYRIHSLPPGLYNVNAGGGGEFARFSVSGFELDAPTYYPSSTYYTAVPVAVRAGDETGGVDIRYKGIEGHLVSGMLGGKLDPNAANNVITVFLTHASTNHVLGLSVAGVADQNRSFSFSGLEDGDYDVSGVFVTDISKSVSAASRRVTVRGADVTGVELSLMELGAISGTLKLDPIAPELKCDKRKSALSEVVIDAPRDNAKKDNYKILKLMMGGFGVSLSPNGEFGLRNIEAGTYRPRLKLPTDAWYVRAIDLPTRAPSAAVNPAHGNDSAPGPGRPNRPPTSSSFQGTITIKSGETLAGISIQIGQDAAGLRGTFDSPDRGAIPAGLRVYLVPAERDQVNNVLRYFESTVESSGSFAFTNVAPGRYLIFPRIEPVTEEPSRPVAIDAAARNILRRGAESLDQSIELKPCQRMADVILKIPGTTAP